MTPSPTFDRVYVAIRERLMAGYWLPGQRIDLPKLADDLVASMTPVRDALNRLTGERLIVPGTSEGFAMPAMTEPELRDLYDWHHQLLLLALRGGSGSRSRAKVLKLQRRDPFASLPALVVAVTNQTNNLELRRTLEFVDARLAPAFIIERRLSDESNEIAKLSQAWLDANEIAFRNGLAAWHRRRLHAAGRVVYLLHRPLDPDVGI